MFRLVGNIIFKKLLSTVLALTFAISSLLLSGCGVKATSKVKVETTNVA